MKFLRNLLFIVALVVFAFGIFLFYSTLTDYKPAPEELVFSNPDSETLPDSLVLDLMSWNIGYAGLSSEMDFFYDGGKNVRPPREKVEENVHAILKEIKDQDTMNFILLQEVDFKSKRSYRINESDSLLAWMKDYKMFIGRNYDVTFVPVPPKAPMGHVESGIVTLSRYTPASVKRYAFPVNFSWPTRLFMLDRCFLVSRFNLNNGKELLIINTHNSAYDNGVLSTHELQFLSEFIKKEYDLGNYVITGGDWNQSPPDLVPAFAHNKFDTLDLIHINGKLLPDGWQWVYDPSTPSNRRVDFPYNEAKTRTTVIDQFLISPNVQMVSVKTLDLGFAHSDHHPVTARFKLINHTKLNDATKTEMGAGEKTK
jgi:endonuclease/exonuclease/phosphatase family metal-dependent hydrolase